LLFYNLFLILEYWGNTSNIGGDRRGFSKTGWPILTTTAAL
jgi:hypothetical protein